MINQDFLIKNRFKFMIIGLIIVAITGLILFSTFAINKDQNSNILPLGRENTATLQIYAALEEEIPIEDVAAVVKNINSNAIVDIKDNSGTIRASSDSEDLITFLFETEESVKEYLLEAESDDEFEETYTPNIAYAFTYIYPIGPEDALSIYYDQNVFYYYDNRDLFEFPTKQEAIDAYLAPVFDN